MFPQATTLRTSLTRALWRSLVCCVLLAAPIVGASFLPIPMTFASPESPAITHDRPDAKGSQAQVIASSGCVKATEGSLPSSVVADPAGVRSWTHLTSERRLGHAFEQLVFDGVLEANEWTQPVDHGMRVGIFCA